MKITEEFWEKIAITEFPVELMIYDNEEIFLRIVGMLYFDEEKSAWYISYEFGIGRVYLKNIQTAFAVDIMPHIIDSYKVQIGTSLRDCVQNKKNEKQENNEH